MKMMYWKEPEPDEIHVLAEDGFMEIVFEDQIIDDDGKGRNCSFCLDLLCCLQCI